MTRKLLTILPIFFLSGLVGKAQNGDFSYPAQTIDRLKSLVDSLHRLCKQSSPRYYSQPQTWGYLLSMDERLEEFQKDLKAKMPFDKFREKYPKAFVDTQPCFVTKVIKPDKTGKPVVEYQYQKRGIPFIGVIQRDASWIDKHFANEAILESSEENGKQILDGLYLVEDFRTQEIPAKYAHQIHYAACLARGTDTLFTSNTQENFAPEAAGFIKKYPNLCVLANLQKEAIQKFDKAVPYPKGNKHKEKFAGEANQAMPKTKDMEIILAEELAFQKAVKEWETKRQNAVSASLAKKKDLHDLVQKALQELKRQNTSFQEAEMLLAPYITKSELLALMLRRDTENTADPSKNPFDIASLAAELGHWRTFMAAHFALAKAQDSHPYYRTLDLFGINTLDCLFGLVYTHALRTENPDKTVIMVSKALKDWTHTQDIEELLTPIIADETLDAHNRLYAYRVLLYHLGTENPPAKVLELLAKNKDTMFFQAIIPQ